MNHIVKNRTLQFGFIVFCALVSINLWSFQKISGSIYKLFEALALLGLIIIVLANSHIFSRKDLAFKANVHCLIWIPFLSAFGAYQYHDQPLNLSLLLLRDSFFWLFYFTLHIFDIPKKKVISLMIFIGCVWAFLTIAQQFTYPVAFFYTRDDESQSILRAGVYRFMLTGQQYGLFVLLYFFYKYLNTNNRQKLKALCYAGFGLIGFYYYGTRQYALAAIVCMGVAILLLKARARAKYIALMIPVIAVVWLFKDALFGKYIEMTNQQMAYGFEEDIRMLCADFYLNVYWPSWVTKIIGNGPEHLLSDYGKEMDLILQYFHFYRSDVGIIGIYNKFGILYVISILWISIKAITKKLGYDKDKYLKLFFFNALFLLIINESFSKQSVIPFYCFILYLMDKSVQEKKAESAALQQD